MAIPSKTVLIITGSGHVPQHYQKLAAHLVAKGIRVLCEPLPTNNGAVPPNNCLDDDVQFIKKVVAKEVATGAQITVLAHSYGGMIATGALVSFAIPADSPHQGGVTDIIYLASFIPAENQSLAEVLGGSFPSYIIPLPDKTFTWSDSRQILYTDLSEEDAKAAESLRVNQSWATQWMPLRCDRAAWRDIPISYIFCDHDNALPLFAQELMVNNVRDAGVKVKEYHLAASHSAFWSLPEEVTAITVKIMGREG